MAKRLIHPSERPSQYDMQQYEEHLAGIWAEAQAVMQEIDLYYNRLYPIWDESIPQQANRPRYNSPRAPALVDQAVNSVVAYQPQFHRVPLGDQGEDDIAAASRIEHGLQDLFTGSAQSSVAYAPRIAAHHMVRYNYAQTGLMLNQEAFAMPPKKRRGEKKEDFELREWIWKANRHTNSPINIVAPSPTEVLLDPTMKSPPIAIRKVKITGMKLAELTSTKAKRLGDTIVFDSSKGDPYAEYDATEWWSPWWFGVCANNAYYVEPNQWGFQPWNHSFGEPAAIPIGSAFNPAWFIKRAILYNEMSTIKMLDQATVSEQNIIIRAAFAKLRYDGSAAEGAAQLEGGIVSGDGDDWGLLPTPQLAAGSAQYKASLDDMITRTSYSPSAAGFPQSDVDTATNAIILAEATGRTFKGTVVQLEQLFSGTASNALKLTERIPMIYKDSLADIMGGPNPLLPNDINGTYQITADFANVDAVISMQTMQSAQRERKEGLIGSTQYYEKTNQEDPVRIRESIIQDEVRADPEVHFERKQAAMREMGYAKVADRLDEQVAAAKAAEEAAQAQAAPQPPEAPPALGQNGGGGPQPAIPIGPAAVQEGGPLNERPTPRL
jgi:hypothetical protein